EAVAVGDGSFLVGALPGTGVDEGAQLLGQRDQGGGNRLAVQPGHAEDARGDAQAGLGGEERLHTGVLAVGRGADDVAGGLRVVFALFYAHDDGDGVGLVGDGLQAARQSAFGTGGTDGGGHIGEQHRFVQREYGGVGICGGTHHADHGGGDGADRAGAFVDLDDTDAVMVLIGHGGSLQWVVTVRVMLSRERGDWERCGLYGRGLQWRADTPPERGLVRPSV